VDASDLDVVEELGVFAGALGEPQDGVEADLAQPGRGSHTDAVGEVLRDGGQFLLGTAQAEESGVGRMALLLGPQRLRAKHLLGGCVNNGSNSV